MCLGPAFAIMHVAAASVRIGKLSERAEKLSQPGGGGVQSRQSWRVEGEGSSASVNARRYSTLHGLTGLLDEKKVAGSCGRSHTA